MKEKALIKNVEKFVQKVLGKEGTGHDWWHIKRVRNNAKLICRSEKANWLIVDLAILLHDVGDRKVIGKEVDDPSIAENFLKKQKVSAETVEKVMCIIQNMSFSKTLNKKSGARSIEFKVVQDADRLDALGAIGIARAFAYGGSKSRPLYDPTRKARKITTTKSYTALKSSTFHHFEEKLLLLEKLMNTKTAKKIAKKRDAYMRTYLKEFLAEWEGKR